ncbi:D-alanyl-D-alanine carboxypeptidase/D-alanyl-D-alanine-endopeptidase [Rhodoferax sp.]|uniref:D-alanyl-D-alanine carboxypeptidase/D-alanyl-D-alanine endopeptidase n=1 Tax=Rhodoferax sp. TaxID=50421 RepID=UPI00263641B9|nr:D-alanyl-D-alanine carboxypeptidase/D-alanyl-D-alanine-endopeptidase [Rhodoferax sp.]MDD2917368.1 D-alanyl-D-alanine carboxypeptidase/D-alanyl-D-alanine-endopeptidase [Rhodoferax sp.]
MQAIKPLTRYLANTLLCVLTSLCDASALAQALPSAVQAAFTRAQVPTDAIALLVRDADGRTEPRLSHRADQPMNPASVMKLVTTAAALDLLGPAYTWPTPVWVDGPVVNGMLQGNVIIRGQGDPKLVLEKLWLLLRRLQSLGIHTIAGDILLDNSAFEAPATDPAEFDSEPLRPYNAGPDALLINFKSVVMTFVPDPLTNSARVQFDPPLWGVQLQTSVPLSQGKSASNGACGDYRANLKADFSEPTRIRFNGGYPASCGEKVWPVAYADPASYNARVIEGLWRSLGGQLSGTVRSGTAPAESATFEITSPTLAEVIRDINKFSNNVMAQQLFLTLGLPAPATPASAREAVRQWWQRRISATDVPTIDNGSGLSRQNRISAQQLGQLLQLAYASPYMPELMSSLPLVGVDGTLKRSKASSASAHLKTGSLKEVTALAGYVHAASGKRYALVAIVNHPNAAAVRPALDALIDWAVMDNLAR